MPHPDHGHRTAWLSMLKLSRVQLFSKVLFKCWYVGLVGVRTNIFLSCRSDWLGVNHLYENEKSLEVCWLKHPHSFREYLWADPQLCQQVRHISVCEISEISFQYKRFERFWFSISISFCYKENWCPKKLFSFFAGNTVWF